MLRIYTVALFASATYAWSNSIYYYHQVPTLGACCNRALGCRNEPALICCEAPFARDLFLSIKILGDKASCTALIAVEVCVGCTSSATPSTCHDNSKPETMSGFGEYGQSCIITNTAHPNKRDDNSTAPQVCKKPTTVRLSDGLYEAGDSYGEEWVVDVGSDMSDAGLIAKYGLVYVLELGGSDGETKSATGSRCDWIGQSGEEEGGRL